jgi:hypothetical protein
MEIKKSFFFLPKASHRYMYVEYKENGRKVLDWLQASRQTKSVLCRSLYGSALFVRNDAFVRMVPLSEMMPLSEWCLCPNGAFV